MKTKPSVPRRKKIRRRSSSAIEVAVVGHGCLDLASLTQTENLPAGNTLAVIEGFRMALGGPALAAAVALSRLGVAPRFYGCLGDDEIALAIAQMMQIQGIDMSGVSISPGSSSATMIVPREHGRSFMHAPGHNLRLTPGQIKPGAFRNARVALIAGIGLLPGLHGQALAALVQRAKRENPRIIVVTDTVHPGANIGLEKAIGYIKPALPFIDVFCTSVSEGQFFCTKDDAIGMAKDLRAMGMNRSIVIKRGGDGVAYLGEGEGDVVSLPAHQIGREKDGTGAGDGFCAALVAALARGLPLKRSVQIGSVAGAKIAEAGIGTRGIPSFSKLRRLARC